MVADEIVIFRVPGMIFAQAMSFFSTRPRAIASPTSLFGTVTHAIEYGVGGGEAAPARVDDERAEVETNRRSIGVSFRTMDSTAPTRMASKISVAEQFMQPVHCEVHS